MPVRRSAIASLIVPLAAVTGCAAAGESSVPNESSGDPQPAVAEDLAGRSVDPLATAAGQVVVLTFVRIDCPISNRYAPTLRKLSREFAKEGANFYLVYPNPDANVEAIRTHLQEYDWGMTALRDPKHALVDLAGATITPEAAVFDREGKLVYHGRIDDRNVDFGKSRPAPTTHDLEDAIRAALAGEPVSEPATEAVGCFIVDLKRDRP